MAAATIRNWTFAIQDQKPERAVTLRTQTVDYVLGSQSHEVASALEDTFLRLDAISKLTEGWDSYGAEAPSKGSLSLLRSLIGKVLAERLSLIGKRAIPFNVAPNPDGGVIAEWRNGPKFIEIDANPDGTCSYFVKYLDRSDERHGVDELAVLRLIPTVVD